MSEKKQGRLLRALQGAAGYALALLLALLLAAACVLTLAEQLLTNQELHERVALDGRVLDAQSARVEEAVRELAKEYHFAPEAALDLASQENMAEYGREMVAWWMGLMGEEPDTEAPFPDTSAVEEAVRADELFCESTEVFMRKSIARDEVAYPIGLAVQESVMPLRMSLISLGLPEVAARADIPALFGLLGTAKTVLFGLSAALLILLLLTQGRRRFLFGSAGLMAAFVLLAVMTAALAAADLPTAMTEYSPILALQLGILLGELTAPVLLAEGAVLLLGALLLALWVRAAGRKRA